MTIPPVLNLLGLSDQVPARWTYLSDGPNREYQIKGHSLIFKKSALKDIGFKYRESGLVLHALKSLGRKHVNQKVIISIRQHLETKDCDRILKDTRSVTGWIYEIIKQTCREND